MVAVFEASLLCLTVKLSILICYKTHFHSRVLYI